jgi:transformation/transcription domain-associated protein
LIDALADPEYAQVLPHFIPTIVGILRSGEVSFQKDSLDAQFRRILVEILHRIPFNDHVRPMSTIIFAGMLHILRHDNEENGVTCSKAIMDLIRAFKSFPQDLIPEFFSILQELLRNAPGLVEEFLADDSLPLDPNTMLPSVRSFKVLSELSILIVTLVQLNRTTAGPILQSCLSLNVDLLTLESPSQKKAREDFESMGGIWSGMAESIKNPQLYSDFINCQIKVSICRPGPHSPPRLTALSDVLPVVLGDTRRRGAE